MNSREYQEIQKAYFEVYEDQQIDEVSDELANKARKERWNRTGVAMEKDLGNMKSGPSPEFQASYKKAQNNERRFNEKTQKEEVDLHAAILSHLLDEGYADTLEAAEGIMVSMSEEWKQSIMERDAEPGEEDDSPDVRAHNRSLKDKAGKKLYPSGRAGNARRPDPSKDPRYGSQY